jgi:hypothetical protein
MNKTTLPLLLLCIIYTSCGNDRDSIPEQLKSNFSKHVNKIDPSIIVDSFQVLKIDTMVEKLGRIIDDSIYKRELYHVQNQLANAQKERLTDSVEFYNNEIKYMLIQIDSVTNSIRAGDTKKAFGFLVICQYQISKNNSHHRDSIFYFFDTKMNIVNADMIDSVIYRSYRRIR